MRLIAGLCAIAIVGSLLWIGGEAHRQNCLRTYHHCTVLPWDQGSDPGAPIVRVIQEPSWGTP